eukprot:1423262-Prymnesium_polylepis.1
MPYIRRQPYPILFQLLERASAPALLPLSLARTGRRVRTALLRARADRDRDAAPAPPTSRRHPITLELPQIDGSKSLQIASSVRNTARARLQNSVLIGLAKFLRSRIRTWNVRAAARAPRSAQDVSVTFRPTGRDQYFQ